MKRGDYHSATSDRITVTVWKDTNDVTFICNVHSSRVEDTTGSKQKDGSICAISAPPVVKDYNTNMGAIDKSDQVTKSYARHLQSECRHHVPVQLQKVEQWSYGRRPSSSS